jgi:hypothetical protein
MNHRLETRPQAIQPTRVTTSRVAAIGLWIALLSPAILAAQNLQSASSASTPQNQVTFTQQSLPEHSRERFTLPENECSADFWNPYDDQGRAGTESLVGAQENTAQTFDSGDIVQALPDEVVEPSEAVQQLNSELVQPCGSGPRTARRAHRSPAPTRRPSPVQSRRPLVQLGWRS